jgi:hypothetical protein
LDAIGYRPLVQVKSSDFADAGLRENWIKEKNMVVFQMLNPSRQSTRLGIFVAEPFGFPEQYAAARWEDVAGVRVPVVQYSELLRLKRAAGRPRDLIDIEQLELMSKSDE